ncbi:MAG: Gfo/Idh/MocA family oxidoreductase [Lachnospiraceae bacterium]|nr:Gfo/Idh/MocA family oxidoreductase [Lachnospiraceae bacterium]
MNHTKPLSFIIVGSGWRSLFYARIAKKYPEQFQLKYMLCRTQEKADKMATEHGIPTTTSIEVCEEAKPDFIIIAVSKNSLCTETIKWAQKGFAVLCETPAAGTVEELKELWDLEQRGAKIQIAEQYHRYPSMAAGLEEIKSGKLHDPYAVSLSMAHDYHGVSLIRRMLQPIDPMSLCLEWLRGGQYTFEVTETDSRYGAITDGRVKQSSRSVITMGFAGGKMAFYDFDGTLYHSYIRTRHVNVQGRDGEWNDTYLKYVDEEHRPQIKQLIPLLKPQYTCLDTAKLCDQSSQWSPTVIMDEEQDEYAIATMMLDMREYIENGKEVYPMAEALEDAYVYLLMQQAIQNPGEKILPERMPWH